MRKLTKAQKRDIAAKREEDIDFSDVPPVVDWSGIEIGKFYRPPKKPVTVRLDADVVEWLQSRGPGYQTKANWFYGGPCFTRRSGALAAASVYDRREEKGVKVRLPRKKASLRGVYGQQTPSLTLTKSGPGSSSSGVSLDPISATSTRPDKSPS